MCGGSPPAPAPAPAPPPPPPPPPPAQPVRVNDPKAMATGTGKETQQVNARRQGTGRFRTDLSIPSGDASGGSGLNIPA